MMAKRIQRKRTKGWRKPPNTVYVGRGSKWGNPIKKIGSKFYLIWGKSKFILREDTTIKDVLRWYERFFDPKFIQAWNLGNITYYWQIYHDKFKLLDLEELRGKNLMCWCKLNEPCHADILLRLANA